MRLIVCITGMPGAGKSTVARAFNQSYLVLNMGDAVRKEVEKRGLKLTDENLGKVMLELREKYGKGAIAELISEEIKESDKDVIIDGIRSMEEVNVLKQYGVVKILAIHAPKDKRLKYLQTRNREDAPKSIEDFNLRDERELKVGIGEAISYADFVITNDSTIEELKEKAHQIINKWREQINE